MLLETPAEGVALAAGGVTDVVREDRVVVELSPTAGDAEPPPAAADVPEPVAPFDALLDADAFA